MTPMSRGSSQSHRVGDIETEQGGGEFRHYRMATHGKFQTPGHIPRWRIEIGDAALTRVNNRRAADRIRHAIEGLDQAIDQVQYIVPDWARRWISPSNPTGALPGRTNEGT